MQGTCDDDDNRASGRPGRDRGDAALRGREPAAPWAEEATPLAAPAARRLGDGRLQVGSLNRRPLWPSWPYRRSTVAVPPAPRSTGWTSSRRRHFRATPSAIHDTALLDRDLGPTEHAVAVDAMEAPDNSPSVDRYAARVH